MEQNTATRQRLVRLEERDREILKVEMSPARTCLYIGIALGVLWLLLCILLFNRFWLALIGATILVTGGRLMEISLNSEVMRDLAEDEKIVTIRKIEKLEINPVTGIYIGGPAMSNDRTQHYQYGNGYCVKIGNLWYPVRKEEYEAMQNATECEFHTAQYSHIFLDCTAIRQ